MNKRLLLIVIVVIVVALGWYFWGKNLVNVSPTSTTTPESEAQPQTLGGQIYEQSQNPIQDKVPTLNPVANPVEDIYKNPFQ